MAGMSVPMLGYSDVSCFKNEPVASYGNPGGNGFSATSVIECDDSNSTLSAEIN